MCIRFGTRLVLIGSCFLAGAGAGRGQDAGGLPVWEPDAARLKRLAAEVNNQTWTIRPPTGYDRHAMDAANESRVVWSRPKEGSIIVSRAQAAANYGGTDQMLDRYLASLRGKARGLQTTPTERGRIQGKQFVRIRFSAEGLAGMNGPIYGFVYLTVDGERPLGIMGAGTSVNIEDLEAAALTLHLLK